MILYTGNNIDENINLKETERHKSTPDFCMETQCALCSSEAPFKTGCQNRCRSAYKKETIFSLLRKYRTKKNLLKILSRLFLVL